jgi:hypothetical protein
VTCDGCGHEAYNYSVTEEGDFCKRCLKSAYTPGANLHVRGVNPHAPRMTFVEKEHIKSRRAGPDGYIRAHPRYETKDY